MTQSTASSLPVSCLIFSTLTFGLVTLLASRLSRLLPLRWEGEELLRWRSSRGVGGVGLFMAASIEGEAGRARSSLRMRSWSSRARLFAMRHKSLATSVDYRAS